MHPALPDLEHAKAAVLNSLGFASAQRTCRSASRSAMLIERNGAARNPLRDIIAFDEFHHQGGDAPPSSWP